MLDNLRTTMVPLLLITLLACVTVLGVRDLERERVAVCERSSAESVRPASISMRQQLSRFDRFQVWKCAGRIEAR